VTTAPGSASRWQALLLLAPGLGLLAVLFGGPLLWSVFGSFGLSEAGDGFTLAHYREIFLRPTLQRALLMSVWFGLAPVALTLIASIVLALLMRRHFLGRALFNGLYKIPMAVPGIIAALVVLTLAERGGFLDRVAALGGVSLPRLVRDEWGIGVILATVWKQVPFMTLVIGGAFAGITEDLRGAARSLGANRWRTLLHVELPLAMPGISAAVLLTFIGSMGSFAIPDLVGPASPRPLAVHMVAEFGSGNFPLVYAIGVVLSAFAVAVLLGYYALAARASQRLAGAPGV
jgi:putative spermidine/putrescine transport system permease protein